ncbi:hypothetical protein [Heliothis virescens ascovirus 3e]|uniref:Uncharacterized protein n=1 Tax=Heliothis virescens ascovirus 3e TaxID=260797 RepID=A4KXA2_HVAVE|nr:hypothetical protein HVAV3e_gp046 [Heliothis virescens ascovirus 3e]ABO37233.1 hypothetical protein [Heliothis virescens ascovirus 3e]
MHNKTANTSTNTSAAATSGKDNSVASSQNSTVWDRRVQALRNVLKKQIVVSVTDTALGGVFAYATGSIVIGFSMTALASALDASGAVDALIGTFVSSTPTA